MKINITELDKQIREDKVFAEKKTASGFSDKCCECLIAMTYVNESITERIKNIEKCVVDLEKKYPSLRYCKGKIRSSNLGFTTIEVPRSKDVCTLRIYYMCQLKYIFESKSFKYEVVFEDICDGLLETPRRKLEQK